MILFKNEQQMSFMKQIFFFEFFSKKFLIKFGSKSKKKKY